MPGVCLKSCHVSPVSQEPCFVAIFAERKATKESFPTVPRRRYRMVAATLLLVPWMLLACESRASEGPAEVFQASHAEWVGALGGRVEINGSGEVTAVELSRTWVNDADLRKLAEFPQLEQIDLSYTKVTDLGLEHLAPLQNVRVLNLRYAENVTDLGVAHLKQWRSLASLDVRGTKVTSSLFEHVASMSRLRFLDVGFSRVNDDLFEKLSSLEQLEHFGIGGNKMSGVAFPLLKLLPGIRVLDVAGQQRTDSGLWSVSITDFNIGEIAEMDQLEQLDVSDSGLTDRGVSQLAALKKMRVLNLSGTRVSARGLESLAGLPDLTHLQLSRNTRIDDRAVPVLLRLDGLKVLELQETSLTAEGLLQLGAMKSLEQLFLGGIEVPWEAVENFGSSYRVARFRSGRDRPRDVQMMSVSFFVAVGKLPRRAPADSSASVK
jgi:hypothetical protein